MILPFDHPEHGSGGPDFYDVAKPEAQRDEDDAEKYVVEQWDKVLAIKFPAEIERGNVRQAFVAAFLAGRRSAR